MYPGTFDSHRKSEHISNSFCHLFWCEVRRCRVLLTSRLLMTGCGTREGAWEMCVCAQSCPTICDPIDSSLPDSTVCGIFQARILEWDAISFSNASMHAKSLQSYLTLCDPIDGSPPGSSVHEILKARILQWVAISFSRYCYWGSVNLNLPP